MKIYLMTDMEGVCGIHMPEQVWAGKPAYEEGRTLLIGDINAAVEAAYEAGATQVIVCDGHNFGGQIRMGQVDPRAFCEAPTAGSMMPSLDESFAGVVLLGHHARAGTLNGFLDHTIRPEHWYDFAINGQIVGEIAIMAAYAGHFGVPVIAVTGDQATADEAREHLGNVPTAVVKLALGAKRARCLPLADGRAAIRSAVAAGIAAIGRLRPWKPTLPAIIRISTQRSAGADDLAVKHHARRVSARCVEYTIDSFEQIFRW